ncbi:CPBP family intramembrane metalloprotease [Candidatus Nomurabacteria bacterium]|nr:CPBP family intramembrane metalloprotease [Candidatus Nomurabacteria bacterium]
MSTLTTVSSLSERQIQLLRLEYFTFALLPVLLIYLKIIPQNWQYLFGALVTMSALSLFLIYRFIKKQQWSWQKVGFTLQLKKDFWLYGPVILIGAILFFVAPFVVDVKDGFNTNTTFWFTFVGSPLQELLYRVYLLTIGALLFSPRVNFVANVSMFAVMHVVYGDPEIVIPSVVFAGMMFTGLYMKSQNVILISITHIVWNALAVYVGIFN